jgi:hypothetical protein
LVTRLARTFVVLVCIDVAVSEVCVDAEIP